MAKIKASAKTSNTDGYVMTIKEAKYTKHNKRYKKVLIGSILLNLLLISLLINNLL